MDAPLYDIYLTGKLADNVSPALAAQRLAGLFKSTPAAMAALITGKAQLVKRGVDKNTALKYRDALQKAGCEVACKAQSVAVEEKPTPIAARPTSATPAPASATTTPETPTSGLQLAPAGEDLLRVEERRTTAPVNVETAHLNLAPVGPLPASAPAAAATPDISHLSLAAAGDNLLSESERAITPAITPDISGLSVTEAGAPIETLKSEITPLRPDTSGLELAPAGSDLLTPEQRQHPQTAAPNTDHITLAP
jgi:hypothetical protein